ncbi:zinc metallopeptidase [Chitinophaga horti]|uniref:Zinc metallopeptidase n=1 Tax=Chitinophaga horti TaxID=2920382 RepID=A0ABY6IZX8_9BACT|nr:zinc metallopeptidase [Chitinophaga horti]UYQ92974.1 zinc metallopeptidase [Chitinophaga horti]
MFSPMISPAITLTSIAFLVIGMLVSWRLKSKFKEFSLVPTSSGLSGREVAEKMLRDNGITDVRVTLSEGFLSDHFNPATKTVALSPDVYEGRSVAAAAVAAHECGHAVQYATNYPWIALRSKLVPAVQFSSSIVPWVLMIGVLLINAFPALLLGGIILFGVTTLFSIITLPVEFDASRRGLAWLESTNITRGREQEQAKDALKWAAMTYVIAAISSLVILIQYIMIYAGGRRD